MNRFAIRASVLDEIFPQFAADLVRNSFVSINAGYTLANRSTTAPHGYPKHDTEHLRFLCACYVDIDYYKLGLSVLQVRAALEQMWYEGSLPEPSMDVDSGHGMWLLWLLHDPEEPTRAHLGAYADNRNDHLQLYTRVNKALYGRLGSLGADAISDGARHIRVPGSWRNDHEAFVRWRVHGESDRVNSYTLRDLAARCGVTLSPRPVAERAALRAVREESGKPSAAWIRTNQNRLAAIVTIKDQRAGGFNRGCRNRAAYLYALSLRWNLVGRKDALNTLIDMASHCTPPLTRGECERAVRFGYKTRNPKVCYQTIADDLDVTPSEAEIVSQVLYGNAQGGDKRFFPAARRFGDYQPTTNTTGSPLRADKAVTRHLAILRVAAECSAVPSVRQMQAALLSQRIEVSIGTLHSDYKRLGLVSGFFQRQKDANAAFAANYDAYCDSLRKFLAA